MPLALWGDFPLLPERSGPRSQAPHYDLPLPLFLVRPVADRIIRACTLGRIIASLQLAIVQCVEPKFLFLIAIKKRLKVVDFTLRRGLAGCCQCLQDILPVHRSLKYIDSFLRDVHFGGQTVVNERLLPSERCPVCFLDKGPRDPQEPLQVGR